ncbi:ATP-dependent DNA helicase RecG [Candidatus Parcubacteria bacterium]|nr:ATP-dependent DNA helicase RecG [Patescibacteria group bacterium]MCG2688167.1 ATP-dependent DNA helicase RecG [Candidatus Parcubacteria bacterium]
MDFASPIEQIPRIGPTLQKRFRKLGVKTAKDLIYHFPIRYEDFSNFSKISLLKARTDIAIRGKILEIKSSLAWRKKMTLTKAVVGDDSGAVKIIWFGKPYITDNLEIGDQVIMAGRVSQGKEGLYLNNPSYEKLTEDGPLYSSRVVGLMPIYPETEKLSSKWLRGIVRQTLGILKDDFQEFLPESFIKEFNLLPLSKAVWQIHFPDSLELAEKARKRFALEELFLIETFVLRERIKLLQTKAHSIPMDIPLIKRFVDSLPFKLTDAQRKSSWQILKDLEKTHPTNRLLEGEVGSGKTVVAGIAALNTAKAGFQVAIMAPTEILTKQHFKEIAKMLFKFKLTIALLTGKEDQIMAKKLKGETIEASRRKILDKCLKGEIDILIGTHALIQDKVKFKNLGLVVVDEQHRFGIEQRAKLLKEGKIKNLPIPHLLSMTATPIPRSLALTIYGDLDLSIIDEMPKGRRKIITRVVLPKNRQEVYNFIRNQIDLERQAFIICPRIEPSSVPLRGTMAGKQNQKYNPWAGVKAVAEEKEKLEKEIFPDLRVEMLHGRMKPKEKEKIMSAFAKGYGGKNKIDILVATSVVEVGIDIPNASVMVIESADRFGLAQLHQLRGRVGRSSHQSYCFLFTDSSSLKTKQRLKAMIKAQDGFELAEKDLEIRGPGEFGGKKQWGIPDLAMASLKDFALVAKVKQSARENLEKDPHLKNQLFLKKKLQRFQQKVHFE